MKNTVLLIAATFALVTTQLYAEPTTTAPNTAVTSSVDQTIIKELVGEWKNSMKSTLTITEIDASSGMLKGTYVTSTGAGGAFPAIGWVNTKPADSADPNNAVAIAWTVRWGKVGSITSWTGIYGMVDGVVQIIGQWNLTRPNSDFEWDHIVAGQDRFLKLTK